MNERDDIDALAGEYVLGTLDAAERAAVAARRRREQALDAAIGDWERRLGSLVELIPPVEPPAGLLERLEIRLDRDAGSTNVVALENGLKRWRRLALTATAAAAALLVTIGVRELSRQPQPTSYVGVFQRDDASPAFLLTVDLEARQLTITSVDPVRQPGTSYQLWIRTEQSTAPRSLGLVEARGFTTTPVLAAYSRDEVERATFGISLEPAGGSPTGAPTGPVIHARLIQAKP